MRRRRRRKKKEEEEGQKRRKREEKRGGRGRRTQNPLYTRQSRQRLSDVRPARELQALVYDIPPPVTAIISYIHRRSSKAVSELTLIPLVFKRQ